MGGFGSGRRGGDGRPLVEEAHALDLPKLMRDGLVRPGSTSGSLVWRIVGSGEETGSVGYRAHLDPAGRHGEIVLSYAARARGERVEVREWISLEPRPQPFGGVQWLLVCPVSGRRVRKLYLPRGARRFAARQVHGLRYASQRLDRGDRAIEQARKVRRTLDASIAIGDPVKRPPGMRRRTFARLLDRLARHEEEVHVATLALLDRFSAVTPVRGTAKRP